MDNPFLPVINSLLHEPQSSLLTGMLFGVKGAIPSDLYRALVDTGTLHVIALSGMNISILTAITAKFTLFLGRRVSSAVTIVFITLFILFVGPSPSVVRAGIMGSLSLVAVIVGRQYWAFLSLIITGCVMLIFSPELMKDLSFQLSFLATAGIIAGSKIKTGKRNGILGSITYSFQENLKTTLSAQLFTMPVILFNFRRLSIIAPLANLLTGWSVQYITVLGLIVSLAGLIWLPLAIVPAFLVWVPLTYFIKVVEVLGSMPGASITF